MTKPSIKDMPHKAATVTLLSMAEFNKRSKSSEQLSGTKDGKGGWCI